MSRTQATEVWSRRELGDDLYNWQFYIQESEVKGEKREEENSVAKVTNRYTGCHVRPVSYTYGLAN